MFPKNSEFYQQVDLLLDCAPLVFKESCFALKGGTAINLFFRELPRLSVDIDLVYLNPKTFEEDQRGISEALDRISADLEKSIPKSKVLKTKSRDQKFLQKISLQKGRLSITIEPNFVIKGTLEKTSKVSTVKKVEDLFEKSATVLSLSEDEVYAGKVCAALDRQHPRDFFDIHQMFEDKVESAKLRKLFIAYLCGSDRPIHEVLFPTPKNIKAVFEKEFAGMTVDPVSLEQLERARDRLTAWIYKTITDKEKEFLLSFVEANPDFSKLGIKGAESFPSITWKQMNLESLKKKDAKKFSLQSSELKKRFEEL